MQIHDHSYFAIPSFSKAGFGSGKNTDTIIDSIGNMNGGTANVIE